jgi:hypothetical protein
MGAERRCHSSQAGEIALLSPEPDVPKAEAYFERSLAVACEQQAKSWELRAAMSMAAQPAFSLLECRVDQDTNSRELWVLLPIGHP